MTKPMSLYSGAITDWRLSDGEGAELTAAQTRPWPVRLTEGSYGGLTLDFRAPDGTSRRVDVEIDRGNVRLLVARDRDECDAILTIQKDGVHAQPNVGSASAYLFDERGVGPTSVEPTPSFGPGDEPAVVEETADATTTAVPDLAALERDAARWRKLEALIRAAYDGGAIETDNLILNASMLLGRGSYRRVKVGLSFADVRDEPVDLATALDAAPFPPQDGEWA